MHTVVEYRKQMLLSTKGVGLPSPAKPIYTFSMFLLQQRTFIIMRKPKDALLLRYLFLPFYYSLLPPREVSPYSQDPYQ